MKKFDDGGAVYLYKKVNIVGEEGSRYGVQHEHPGITRRNECADRIAAGMMANSKTGAELVDEAKKQHMLVGDLVAEIAYSIADCLIAYGKRE